MANRETLEPRAAHCSNAEDPVALAQEALADPTDPDYARERLTQAEMRCQFPAHCVRVAQPHADGLGDAEYARDQYQQAEEACFEAKEPALPGHSLAVTLKDQDKARKLLTKAAEESKGLAEFLTLAQYARQDLNDGVLAKQLLAKIEGAGSSTDPLEVADRGIAPLNDRESATCLVGSAEERVTSLEDLRAVAVAVKQYFADDAWIRRPLDQAESLATDPFALAHLGFLSARMDEAGRASQRYRKAADTCDTAAAFVQLTARPISDHVPEETVRRLHQGSGHRLQEPVQRLRWAQGIVDGFRDAA